MGDFFVGLLYIVIAIAVLMIMIMIHEFGHYTAGKIFKFKILEFSVGFGPKIFTHVKKNGEKFSLRWIPLGGYCAFDGEDENSTDPGAFNNMAWWKRLIVLFSGAFFNFLSGIIFCFILLLVIGSGAPQVNSVMETSPNVSVLQQNDVILKVNGVEPTFLNGGLNGLIAKYDTGENIVLLVERDGNKMELVVQKYEEQVKDADGNVQTDANGVPITQKILGITTTYKKESFGGALLKCIPYTFQMAWECLVILGKLLVGQYGLKDIGGPITTISTIAQASKINMLNLVLFFPLIAVNLAVFNLLPIPALDGARMVFVLIEGIRKKPINREIEARIHMVGLFVLLGFVVLVDILHLFVFK